MAWIGAINWKNTFENALYVGFGVFLGSYVTFRVMVAYFETLQPTINKAIDKETITNTINNAIDLKIDKIKKSDTIQININQEPINNQKPKNQVIKIEQPKDSIKKGFFGRLFSKEKYK